MVALTDKRRLLSTKIFYCACYLSTRNEIAGIVMYNFT